MATCADCRHALHDRHRCPRTSQVRRIARRSGILATGSGVGAAAALMAPVPSTPLLVVSSALATVLAYAVMKELFLA